MLVNKVFDFRSSFTKFVSQLLLKFQLHFSAESVATILDVSPWSLTHQYCRNKLGSLMIAHTGICFPDSVGIAHLQTLIVHTARITSVIDRITPVKGIRIKMLS